MDIITQLTQHMNTILSATAAEYARALHNTDLRGSQLPYLLAVCRLPGTSQDALAGHLGVDKSNVARQMTELEALGYVSRRRDAGDRRRMFVDPTDRAFELLPTLVEAVTDCQRELCRGMSTEERELLAELTTRMAHNAARLCARHKSQLD